MSIHRVDVLVPVYNASSTVRSAIESILHQTFRDLVVHIVDDGSTDDTPRILSELAAEDSRVRIHTRTNGGIVDALNYGLAQCTAEILARIDADDIAYPDRFEVQLAYLDAHPDVVGVGGIARHIHIDGTPTGTLADLAPPDLADPYAVPCSEPYVMHPFLMVRNAAVQAIGGYRQVYYAEDTDLYWRLLKYGRLFNIRELLGDYRLHNASVSGRSIQNGRIMSISSQLTAVSEQRRRGGKADIVFRKDSIDVYREADTLAEMVKVASVALDAPEHAYYEIAVTAKLLELTSYRPYELDAGDCAYIGAVARRGYDQLSADDRGMHSRRLAGAAARIAAAGRLSDALKLLPPTLLPGFAARYFARTMLPNRLRLAFRRKGTKGAPFK